MARWPFRRQTEAAPTSSVPAEVQQYYDAERRDRVGLAWLLALGTLLATVIVVLGLFFGGRWAYRKARHQNTANTSSSQTAQNKPKSPSPASPAPGATPPSPTPSNPPTPTQTTPSPAPLPRTGPDEDL